MDRRNFLKTAPAVLVTPALAGVGTAPKAAAEEAASSFTSEQRRTVELVQLHLLPSEPDAPGAVEVNAIGYLDQTLQDPGFDADVKSFIFKGIGWLDGMAQEQHQRPFRELDAPAREDLLKTIANSSAGERWLSNLITYCLEALLADPIYGGNPNGVGWTWLGHDPGQPRPTQANRYGRLGAA